VCLSVCVSVYVYVCVCVCVDRQYKVDNGTENMGKSIRNCGNGKERKKTHSRNIRNKLIQVSTILHIVEKSIFNNSIMHIYFRLSCCIW
jgi:hypothetical protein